MKVFLSFAAGFIFCFLIMFAYSKGKEEGSGFEENLEGLRQEIVHNYSMSQDFMKNITRNLIEAYDHVIDDHVTVLQQFQIFLEKKETEEL